MVGGLAVLVVEAGDGILSKGVLCPCPMIITVFCAVVGLV